ncbi:MAG: class I SAM-dependent methyltransferase [Candidatus Alcyoniella australis]|nr:class I SAM-dependent methyltransferase [Candidatus Alcyoniella australis]
MVTPLAHRFIVPPFTVLNARSSFWIQRKRLWLRYIGPMRPTAPVPLFPPIRKGNKLVHTNGGLSIFDPVLAEILIHWFCPVGGAILDPFGGEAVKGIVAAKTGREYVGVEVRRKQVEENLTIAARLGLDCRWIVGDSVHLNKLLPEMEYDFCFSSPPYYNLERYRGGDGDLSEKQSYQDFLEAYGLVLARCANKLKPGRLLAMKVGEFRDKKGEIQGFVNDTVDMARMAGLKYFNHLALLMPLVTAPLRAAGHMRLRKVVQVHQTVLVFIKGEPRGLDRGAFPIISENYVDPLSAVE